MLRTAIAVLTLTVVLMCCGAHASVDDEWLHREFMECQAQHRGGGMSAVLHCAMDQVMQHLTVHTGLDLRALHRLWQNKGQRQRIAAKCIELLLKAIADPEDLTNMQAKLGVTSVSQLTQRLAGPRLAALLPPDAEASSSGGADYLFWRFIPPFKGAAVPGNGSAPLEFRSACFRNISVAAKYVDQTAHLAYSADAQTGLLCIDILMFNAAGKLHFEVLLFDEPKSKHVALTPKQLPGVDWLVLHRGVQVFSFDEIVEVVVSFLQTLSLFFGPMTSYQPSASDALNNAIFQNLYNTLPPLLEPVGGSGSGSGNTSASIRDPQTGDLLLVGRMDGEDTFAAWLMGSNVAHVAMIVCNTSTECSVCETRFQSLWWPIDGVQCNPLSSWLQWAEAGAMLVTHLPSRGLAANISVSAVFNYAQQHAGTSYGCPSVLWGWIDTADGSNFPCLPPDFSSHCLAFEHLETVYLLLDSLSTSFSWYLGGSGFSQRVGGGYSMGVAEAMKVGFNQFGWTPQQLAAQPELDNYVYFSLKNGDVYYGRVWTDSGFVCSLLREGGPLAGFPEQSALNCAELTVWNLLRLNFWDASRARQVLGDYTLQPMADVGSTAPYDLMGNACPGHPPHYTRPSNC